MFENLKAAYLEDRERQREKNAFFIEHGYLKEWNEQERKESDKGIERYSTATRWEQYQAGRIDRAQAVAFATKRNNKAIDKEIAAGLAHLERVAAAGDVNYINCNVIWKRNAYWGNNPTAYVTTDCESGVFEGKASGCGYDKESAAVAEAFNKSPAIMKVLYTLKEKALAAGMSDYSKSTVTNVNNRDIIGYGAGYSTIPYFEGGVGVNCFWSILKKAGFILRANYGKREDFYRLIREEEAE